MKKVAGITIFCFFLSILSLEAVTILGFDGKDNVGYGAWSSNDKDKRLKATVQLDQEERVGKSEAVVRFLMM